MFVNLRNAGNLKNWPIVNLDVAADAEGASLFEKRNELFLECMERILAEAPNLPRKHEASKLKAP